MIYLLINLFIWKWFIWIYTIHLKMISVIQPLSPPLSQFSKIKFLSLLIFCLKINMIFFFLVKNYFLVGKKVENGQLRKYRIGKNYRWVQYCLMYTYNLKKWQFICLLDILCMFISIHLLSIALYSLVC